LIIWLTFGDKRQNFVCFANVIKNYRQKIMALTKKIKSKTDRMCEGGPLHMPLFAQALNGTLLCEAERRYRA
jgi:hypothetical protein